MSVNERMVQHLEALSITEEWKYIRNYLNHRRQEHYKTLATHDNPRDEDMFTKGRIFEVDFFSDIISNIILDLKGGEEYGSGEADPDDDGG